MSPSSCRWLLGVPSSEWALRHSTKPLAVDVRAACGWEVLGRLPDHDPISPNEGRKLQEPNRTSQRRDDPWPDTVGCE